MYSVAPFAFAQAASFFFWSSVSVAPIVAAMSTLQLSSKPHVSTGGI
jgi:hypothetical protein